MRVLFTNITLASRSGTEVNVRDLALGLLRRGHRPVVYSPELGDMAAEIRAATVPVVDDLAALAAPPDVIHGHHHPVTLTALLRFPGVPALYHVHDWSSWYDEPLPFPRVVLYAPVDATNADRLELEHGVESGRIRMLLNAVDLARCRPRPPLPQRPGRALVLSNAAKPGGYLDAVARACADAGIDLEVVGSGVGRPSERPEERLAAADVVFAKGRSALEAMAVGAAVVLCDQQGLGQLVTRADVARMRPLNFGRRLLQRPVTADGVLAEIARYDTADAERVAEWVRREADLERALDRVVEVYGETIELGRQVEVDWEEESRAVSAYLRRWAPRFHDFEAAMQLPALRRELDQAAAAAARATALGDEVAALSDEATALGDEVTALRSDLASERERSQSAAAEAAVLRAGFAAEMGRSRLAAAETAALRRELGAVTSTAAWRWRQRLLARPRLAALYRRLKRSPAATPEASSEPTARGEAPSASPGLSIGERATRMVAAGGFLGVPLDGFEEEGRLQLTTLVRLGLRPQSKLLDIGCGCLRGGYWLIHFLDPGRYFGIEPHRGRLELGLSLLLEPGVADAKRPRFDSNPDFDTAVFAERFDVFLARSIWTHASKPQIRRMLDGFRRDGAPGAWFLTSYMPATAGTGDDYLGAEWVGTSHDCDVPGVIRHDLNWIRGECDARGLVVEERPEDDYGGQRWLLLRAASA